MTPQGVYVAVIGPGDATADEERDAEVVGRELADAGAVVLSGGLGGVMAAACRGAQEAGGLTVGLLPGGERSAANPWVTVAIPTGMGSLLGGLVPLFWPESANKIPEAASTLVVFALPETSIKGAAVNGK